MLNNSAYPNFKSHRADTVAREFRTYLRRVLCHPIEILKRQITTRRIKNSRQAYHLVLMQLEHDSAFLMHSPFASMPEFLHCVIKAFAAGAPRHHRLVFKAHPLESGRRALAREIAALAARYKIADRVDYVPGGKLPCPPEVVVERLAAAADLPQACYLRPLAKIQGVFASQAHLWRNMR